MLNLDYHAPFDYLFIKPYNRKAQDKMPKYYCDYCDTYLTHDSPSVRKTHNGGRKHKYVLSNIPVSFSKLNIIL